MKFTAFNEYYYNFLSISNILKGIVKNHFCSSNKTDYCKRVLQPGLEKNIQEIVEKQAQKDMEEPKKEKDKEKENLSEAA